jgi:hypothetical protein
MPSKMNSAPMNVERLLTLQSMLQMRTPTTIGTRPVEEQSRPVSEVLLGGITSTSGWGK